MPVEVIDLLSSPPPPPINDAGPAKRAATPPQKMAVSPRAIDYDVLDLTAESPKRFESSHAAAIINPPVAGAKRTNSGQRRQDNDFMFLSDEYDTAGNIDSVLVSKKPRVSPSPPRRKRVDDSSFRRTASATVNNTTNRRPPQPTSMKRWNSVVDPIESSSPAHGTFNATHWKRANENWLDSLSSSQKKTRIADGESSRLPILSSDPFASSSKGALEAEQTTARTNQPPKKSDLVGLSSDPLDIPLDTLLRKTNKTPVAWDPISSSMPEKNANDHLLSSSPPPPSPKGKEREFIDVDDLAGSDSDDLPDLADIIFAKRTTAKRSYSVSPGKKSKSRKPTGKSIKAVKKAPEEKEAEKKQKAEQREAERERKRMQKEQEKADRALENVKKKALEEVNKLRTDKKVSTPEMIVDLPSSLDPRRMLQIQELLKDMDVEHSTWDSMTDIIRWRRKVSSWYNEEQGHWEPVRPHVEPEGHVLVIVGAAEFVELALGIDEQHLEAHVLKVKTGHPGKTIIYLIEGLGPWMRKNRNLRNRQFQSAVRNENPTAATAASTSSGRRRNTQPQEYIDEDSIEDALLSLQVLQGTLIHHTSGPPETAQWVAVFTQHISTVPYRRAREAATADANFCMESGQVRAGDGPLDTYTRMLQEMTRVTPAIALGVATKFPTVSALVRGLEQQGPLALEACRKSANRDGGFTDRAVGPAVSKRMHKVFTARDPTSTDV